MDYIGLLIAGGLAVVLVLAVMVARRRRAGVDAVKADAVTPPEDPAARTAPPPGEPRREAANQSVPAAPVPEQHVLFAYCATGTRQLCRFCEGENPMGARICGICGFELR